MPLSRPQDDSSSHSKEQAGTADIGVYGMASMGPNLARNLADRGYTVAICNRTADRTQEVARSAGLPNLLATTGLQAFVDVLGRPRKIIVLVQDGGPTDAVISALTPLLDPGDVLVDGGNAHFADTERREVVLRELGLHFMGVGVSGGAEGALTGPCITAGGSDAAYAMVGPLLEKTAARTDGTPCCLHVGPGGAGHFIKMIHNGLEYADAQIIAEAFDLLLHGLRMSALEASQMLAQWNTGELNSYLMELSAEVSAHVDPRAGRPLVELIVDHAEQRGGGRLTASNALELGVPSTVMVEAINAHALARQHGQRESARQVLAGPTDADSTLLTVQDIESAVRASKIVAYAQAFDHIAAASDEYGWNIDRSAVAANWRAGCVIRAPFLDKVRLAFVENPDVPTLLAVRAFVRETEAAQDGWRRAVGVAGRTGVPSPAMAAALAYYDGVRRARLPYSLVVGVRDRYAGGGYRRVDAAGLFHTDWGGTGRETRV